MNYNKNKPDQDIGITIRPKVQRIYRKDKLQFMYNGKQIRNDPYITIGQCFQNDSNPSIFVNFKIYIYASNVYLKQKCTMILTKQ